MKKHIGFLAFTAVALTACGQEAALTEAGAAAFDAPQTSLVGEFEQKAVYTITNQVAGNEVAVFHRAPDGTLIAAGTVATGGTGTGGGLGSQGALALTEDGERLFVVNAGSNDISVFDVEESGLRLVGRTASGGIQPTSLTVRHNVLYVLNAGGDGNITGFTIAENGTLVPIPGSTQGLSGTATRPAQVSFTPDGRQLIVSERATNLLDVFSVGENSVAGARTTVTSAGAVPFGFAFGRRGLLFVSEAAGSASSYIQRRGAYSLASGAVLTNQGAPCWAVVTRDGRFGYTANATGGTISGFRIGTDGAISLLDADGATATVGAGAIDMAVSGNSRYLYQLVRGVIHAFRVQADGHLTPLGTVSGLPTGTAGLAAL
jgi:6-phosphogluconolactonase (cycloisomerase 2 family)